MTAEIQYDWVENLDNIAEMDDPRIEILKLRREIAELRALVESTKKEVTNVRRGLFRRFGDLANMFLECSTKLIEIERQI